MKQASDVSVKLENNQGLHEKTHFLCSDQKTTDLGEKTQGVVTLAAIA